MLVSFDRVVHIFWIFEIMARHDCGLGALCLAFTAQPFEVEEVMDSSNVWRNPRLFIVDIL